MKTALIAKADHRVYDVIWASWSGYETRVELVLTDLHFGWKNYELNPFRKSATYQVLPVANIRRIVILQGCFWLLRPALRVYSSQDEQIQIRTFPLSYGIDKWLKGVKAAKITCDLLPRQTGRGMLFSFRNSFLYSTCIPFILIAIIAISQFRVALLPIAFLIPMFAGLPIVYAHKFFERRLAKKNTRRWTATSSPDPILM